jgi:signal transduction histidine kinase
LLCLSTLLGSKAIAQSIILTDTDNILPISPDLLIFEDKSSKYTIFDILNGKLSNKFNKWDKDIPSLSFTSSTLWCKFSLLNKTGKKVFLEIKPPFLNKIVLYSILKDGSIDSVYDGTLYKREVQEISSGSYIFRLRENDKSFYIKIKTNTRLYIVAQVGTENAFLKSNSSLSIINGSIGGIILMIFLYNLFLFITSRDKIYLFYLLHLLNTFLNFLYFSGLGNEFVWTGQIWVNEHFISIISLGFIFPILFAINYLDSKTHSKTLHRGMLISIVALIIISFINISGQYIISGQLLNIVGFIIIIFVIYTTNSIKKMGYKPAAPFLYAWMFYFTGITIQVLQGLNVIPTTRFTSNALQLGSILEIVTLSLSIAYKINYFKDKMKLSLIGERNALQEKEILIKEHSKQLEAMAEKQSVQIKNKNLILEQKNSEIIKQNEQIKIQNEKLQKVNLLLANKKRIIEEQHNSLLFHKNNLENLIESRTSELKNATDKATEADRLKTAFLKNVSHEIRTPMNAIAGFASLLFDIDMKDKRYDYYIDIISKNTDDLLNLIDNIIELSRIQTGSLKIKKLVFNPKKMFKAIHELFVEKMRDERKSFVSLRLSIPENDEIYIKTDYNRFWQIIFHLLDNAIKYTDKGFVEFGYKFAEHDTKSLNVFIRDTGKGIKQEKLKTVFDRFRKTEDGKTKLYAGTGLGLSLVKGLTEFMNGEINIKTRTKEEFPEELPGTTFVIVFKNIVKNN